MRFVGVHLPDLGAGVPHEIYLKPVGHVVDERGRVLVKHIGFRIGLN